MPRDPINSFLQHLAARSEEEACESLVSSLSWFRSHDSHAFRPLALKPRSPRATNSTCPRKAAETREEAPLSIWRPVHACDGETTPACRSAPESPHRSRGLRNLRNLPMARRSLRRAYPCGSAHCGQYRRATAEAWLLALREPRRPSPHRTALV